MHRQSLLVTNRPRLRTLPPPRSYGNQRPQRQFDGLLMMGTIMPETCWAVSVRQGNRFYDWLLHLVGCFIWVNEYIWRMGWHLEGKTKILIEKLSHLHFVHHKSHLGWNEIAGNQKKSFLFAADQGMAKLSLFTSQCHRNLVMLHKTINIFSVLRIIHCVITCFKLVNNISYN